LHWDATEVIARWLPTADAGVIAAAVAEAAPNVRQAEWLTAALGDPSVLHASTTAPPVIDRLIGALLAAGVTGIEPPRCVRCGRTAQLSQRLDGHRACLSCAHRSRAERCGRCGRTATVCTRDQHGTAMCGPCHRADRTCWEPCARCAKPCPPARRLPDGTVLCKSCNRPIAVCVVCGKERRCSGLGDGQPRCDACAARLAPCSWCHKTAKVAAVWATGPVCNTCRHKGLAAKAVCDGCGQLRRPDPRHPSGRCADCVGLPQFNICRDCGREDRIYRAGRCCRCVLLAQLDALTANATVDLTPLRDTLAVTDRPRAVLRWLETPFVTDAIGRFATGEASLTHDTIDSLGDNLATTRLRAVLTEAGLLPARNEHLARLERWVDTQLTGITDLNDRRALDAFATWWVLRRVRARARYVEPVDTKHARRQIRRAVEFLAFLREHHQTLADCTQADIELWLTGPPARRHVRDFLLWAHRRRLCADLDVPRRTRAWPARQLAAAEHRGIIARLLTGTDLRLTDRAAGLFVACYAQTPARLVRLTTDHISLDDEVTVRFGRDHVVLPPPLGDLVRELLATRRGRAASEPEAASRWLFPGGIPGRPLDRGTLQRHLKAVGVDASVVRTAALFDLAADVPASILTDLVGLDPTTATRWTQAAGGDWAAYAAAKAAR
jgi:hypothetical protein